MILPVLLLVYPSRTGVLAAITFTLVNLVEWPLLLSRGMWWTLYITAPVRTVMIVGMLIGFWRACRAERGEGLGWPVPHAEVDR
jgi:hypothetical protein